MELPPNLGLIPLLLLVGALPQVIAAPPPSSAAAAQLRTALPHAGEQLERGLGIVTPQFHLRLVINCLEGPNGSHFNAAVGHVCQGQGNGILPDLRAAAAAGEKGAAPALRFATIALNRSLEAVALSDGGEVARRARVIASYLQRALDALQ